VESDERQFWIYVLENSSGKFYIGSTGNLSARLAQHNDLKASTSKYAPKNGPWVLVWKEAFPTRSQAVQRERQIKRMKSARWIRENLLNFTERVPARRD
jgi:putative endonuclease